MPVGTEVDLSKPAMEQRREPPLPPQIRAMQLELAQATQRERSLQGEVQRLRADIEELTAKASEDRVGPLTRQIQDLEREIFQVRQAENAARREAAKLIEAGAADALTELEELRAWKAGQDKRDRDHDLVLNLERQKNESRIAELVKGHRAEVEALQSKLAAAESKAKGRRR